MKLATICSGIGAPELAARPLPYELVFASEIAKAPRLIHESNFPGTPLYGDFTHEISKTEWVGKIECMVAGTPCQSFSTAGKQKGYKDSRGILSLEYVRLVRELEVPWMVLENVPGLLNKGFGEVLGLLCGREDLVGIGRWPPFGWCARGKTGYSAAWGVLDAQEFGVPQRRKRVFLVGHFGEWEEPASVLFDGRGVREDFATRGEEEKAHSRESSEGSVFRYNAVGELFLCKSVLHCFPAMDNTPGRIPYVLQDGFVRRIFVREVARCFGFPDRWLDGIAEKDQFSCLGNSMAVPVISWLLRKICR